MKFKEVIIEKNNSGRTSIKPILRISSRGIIAFNKSALVALNCMSDKQNYFIHFVTDEAGSYWFYVNTDPTNGIMIKMGKDGNRNEGKVCNAGLVSQMIKDLDLAIGEGKRNSVRMDIDTENPVSVGKYQAYRIY